MPAVAAPATRASHVRARVLPRSRPAQDLESLEVTRAASPSKERPRRSWSPSALVQEGDAACTITAGCPGGRCVRATSGRSATQLADDVRGRPRRVVFFVADFVARPRNTRSSTPPSSAWRHRGANSPIAAPYRSSGSSLPRRRRAAACRPASRYRTLGRPPEVSTCSSRAATQAGGLAEAGGRASSWTCPGVGVFAARRSFSGPVAVGPQRRPATRLSRASRRARCRCSPAGRASSRPSPIGPPHTSHRP